MSARDDWEQPVYASAYSTAAPEFEALPIRYASWGSRLAALVLDGVTAVVAIIVFLLLIALPLNGEEGEPSDVALVLILVGVFGGPVVYYTVTIGRYGQTLGKKALGIAVRDASAPTEAIGYGRAFGRYLVTNVLWIVFLPGVIDHLWPLWDRRKQALHDKAVTSVVVRERA